MIKRKKEKKKRRGSNGGASEREMIREDRGRRQSRNFAPDKCTVPISFSFYHYFILFLSTFGVYYSYEVS